MGLVAREDGEEGRGNIPILTLCSFAALLAGLTSRCMVHEMKDRTHLTRLTLPPNQCKPKK